MSAEITSFFHFSLIILFSLSRCNKLSWSWKTLTHYLWCTEEVCRHIAIPSTYVFLTSFPKPTLLPSPRTTTNWTSNIYHWSPKNVTYINGCLTDKVGAFKYFFSPVGKVFCSSLWHTCLCQARAANKHRTVTVQIFF